MSEVLDAGEVQLSLEAQWRRWVRRYTWHLDQLPGLFEAMRSDVVPIGAVRYDRDRVDVSADGAPVPFRVEVVDAIDDLWSALVEYSENVDELLQTHAPAVLAPLPRVGRWRLGDGVRGARAGADVRRDAFTLIGWLVERVDWIVPLPGLDDSEGFLFALIRQNAHRFLTPKPEPKRACRVCGAHLVTLRWTARGEISECGRCGDTRVLEAQRPLLSDACWGKAHPSCDVLSCVCSCHDERKVSLYTVRLPVVPRPVLPVAPMSAVCAHSEWSRYRDLEGAMRCGGCGVVR